MKKYILKFGLIGGVVSSILGTLNWFFVAPYSGVSGSQLVGYLSIAFSLLCIPYGIKYFRDELNNGVLKFRQGFLIGLGITSIAGIVMGIHSILFFVLQKDEFMEWQRENLNQSQLAAFNEQISQTPDFVYTPWFQGCVMFLMVFLMGAVINLLSTLLLKRNQLKDTELL